MLVRRIDGIRGSWTRGNTSVHRTCSTLQLPSPQPRLCLTDRCRSSRHPLLRFGELLPSGGKPALCPPFALNQAALLNRSLPDGRGCAISGRCPLWHPAHSSPARAPGLPANLQGLPTGGHPNALRGSSGAQLGGIAHHRLPHAWAIIVPIKVWLLGWQSTRRPISKFALHRPAQRGHETAAKGSPDGDKHRVDLRGKGAGVVRAGQQRTASSTPEFEARRDLVAAAVDIGSNTIKMTVAQPGGQGTVTVLDTASETVRLGQGAEASGRLADDRIEAALATLIRFAGRARAKGATRLLGVATEATRAAANGQDFLQRVRQEAGWEIRVISGDEEADLTFRGLAATHDVSGEVVIADIGGGSTEVIAAGQGEIRSVRSLRLGSGTLTDRLVPSDPPTPEELAACRAAAASLLAPVDVPTGDGTRLLVVGGTGEYLGRLVPAGKALNAASVEAVLTQLAQIDAAVLAASIGIAEARARVLPAGVAIVAALVDRIHPGTIEVARSGIRTGLLLAAFAEAARS